MTWVPTPPVRLPTAAVNRGGIMRVCRGGIFADGTCLPLEVINGIVVDMPQALVSPTQYSGIATVKVQLNTLVTKDADVHGRGPMYL